MNLKEKGVKMWTVMQGVHKFSKNLVDVSKFYSTQGCQQGPFVPMIGNSRLACEHNTCVVFFCSVLVK